MELEFPRQIFEKPKISYFMKIRPVGAELFHGDGQTRRINSRFSQFCEKRLNVQRKETLQNKKTKKYSRKFLNRYSTLRWSAHSEICRVMYSQLKYIYPSYYNVPSYWNSLQIFFCADEEIPGSIWNIRSSEISWSLAYWPLKMVRICCPETSVRNYHKSLRNNPEERSSQIRIFWTKFHKVPSIKFQGNPSSGRRADTNEQTGGRDECTKPCKQLHDQNWTERRKKRQAYCHIAGG